MRQIHIFGKGYLEALPSRRSASSHSRRLSIEQHIFPQRVLGYRTHLLEIYTLPATLTLHFFYLCYSLKPTARDKWLGYISEGWRNFLQGIDQKPKAVWSCTFSGYHNGPLGEPRGRWEKAAGGCLAGTSFRGTFPDAGETFCRVSPQSRKLSGATLFRLKGQICSCGVL